MAEPKKKEPKKTIIDVAHPGESKPSNTSKPVIVGHKPLLKDPMVVEDAPNEMSEAEKPAVRTGEIKIKPLDESSDKEPGVNDKKDDKPAEDGKTIAELAVEAAADKEPEETTEAVEEPKAEETADKPPEKKADEELEDSPEPAGTGPEGETEENKPGDEQKQPNDPAKEEQIQSEKQAKHDAEIQELTDSKKFYLPINAVEKRRSKRVVLIGVVLSLVLALAWVNVALDAGLIEINGIKPLTHFFSN